MSEENQSYSDLLLGGSMEAILDATDSKIPRITEAQFINEVLPLLERPFYHASMSNYVRFVDELTNPLRVVDPSGNVLFEVPPFIQTTGVTLPAPGAPTTDTTLRNIYAEGERGVDIHPMIAGFMGRVARKPDLLKDLLDPLKEILARYGRTIDLSDEKNAMTEIVPETAVKPVAEIPTDSSFTGEYE